MNNNRVKSIVFVVVIALLLITPFVLPNSYAAKINPENVDKIDNFSSENNNKIYRYGTPIRHFGIEMKYYFNNIKFAEYSGVSNEDYYYYAYDTDPVTGGNINSHLELDSDEASKLFVGATTDGNDLSKISDYWKVRSYSSIGEGIVEFEPVFEKTLNPTNIENGLIIPNGVPIETCESVNYLDASGQVVYSNNLNYPHNDTYESESFISHLYDDNYYIGRFDQLLYSGAETDYWVVDSLESEGEYNTSYSFGCISVNLKPVNIHIVTVNNNDSLGTFTKKNNLDYDELIEGNEVKFSLNPKYGYMVSSVNIVDESNNPVNYTVNNGVYQFIMPAANVSITTNYTKVKNSINVEIVNETEDLNVNITDMTQVEYGEEVDFNVKPIKGFKLNGLRIIDSSNNEIQYVTSDNVNFTFTMPATDVTIIPSYERVKNAVIVEDNENTKEFTIEVADATAVVYEDTVVFSLQPDEGYEVDKIDITDEENNKISYNKTNVKNQYQFRMPDTDVTIKPFYRKINSGNSILNPNTGRNILIFIVILVVVVGSLIFFIKKKKSKD